MAKNYEHTMLDLETLGTKPGCAILSIGAVEFDIETGNTGREFYQKVNLRSCIDAGLDIDPDTLLWWMNQDESARQVFNNEYLASLRDALKYFSDFCNPNTQIWGNSASFDCGILSEVYNKTSIPIPWKFYNERDVRTLVSFDPKIKKDMVFEGVKHNAVDDCRHQIKYCSEIWKKLNK